MNKACDVCKGACCESMKINFNQLYPKFMTMDTLRWIQAHGTVEENGLRLETPCNYLKDGQCSAYSQRPQVCRIYDLGGKACREAIKTRRNDDPEILKLL